MPLIAPHSTKVNNSFDEQGRHSLTPLHSEMTSGGLCGSLPYGFMLPPLFPPSMGFPSALTGAPRNPMVSRPGKGGIGPRTGACASRHMAAEQRRRARINERLESLRTLVPHSERSNTAAFLSEVFDYISFLHRQLERLGVGLIDLNVEARAEQTPADEGDLQADDMQVVEEDSNESNSKIDTKFKVKERKSRSSTSVMTAQDESEEEFDSHYVEQADWTHGDGVCNVDLNVGAVSNSCQTKGAKEPDVELQILLSPTEIEQRQEVETGRQPCSNSSELSDGVDRDRQQPTCGATTLQGSVASGELHHQIHTPTPFRKSAFSAVPLAKTTPISPTTNQGTKANKLRPKPREIQPAPPMHSSMSAIVPPMFPNSMAKAAVAAVADAAVVAQSWGMAAAVAQAQAQMAAQVHAQALMQAQYHQQQLQAASVRIPLPKKRRRNSSTSNVDVL
eukprot:TRINITY_DN2435_c0_g1_i7.p1 TRINITY_DN2435_c0_g1~~TRINITY_DN2435_c0_g1_i7.p1  ORF type:complete len:449 (+),score=59.46 TRINITY_DN2435_c0_g1_i7:89-1435(+)